MATTKKPRVASNRATQTRIPSRHRAFPCRIPCRSGYAAMTTAAPPRALVTRSPRSSKGRGPAYPMYTHWALARGGCAPLRTPGSRAAAGAADGRGLLPPNPRTGAPSRRRGVLLWPPTLHTRTKPPTAWRRPSGSPPSGSGPTRPSAASERVGSPPWSASRITRRSKTWRTAASTRPRADSWPSRRDGSRRRRGLGVTPGTAGKSAGKFGRRGRFSEGKGGVLPAPHSARMRRAEVAAAPPKRNGANGFRQPPRRSGMSISTHIRGV